MRQTGRRRAPSSRAWGIITLALVLGLTSASCSTTPDPTPIPTYSTWGEIITIGQAEQTQAPAIIAGDDNRLAATWVDAADSDVFQVIHFWTGEIRPDADDLSLSATFPHRQTLAPAADDRVHLLWLDIDPDDPIGGNRLWAITVTPDLQGERGTIRLSDRRTDHYSAATIGSVMWVVWSGGVQSEPSLYVQRVDGLGRPQVPEPIIAKGDWPVLAHGDDALYLYWLGVPHGHVYRAVLREGVLEDAAVVTTNVPLERGDRLVTFDAGIDGDHVYLFWNIVRANGDAQTWMTSGSPDADHLLSPVRMGVAMSDKPFETGYNGDSGQQAAAGSIWLSWAAPIKGPSNTLAVAAQVRDSLSIVYLRDGEIVGYQHVVTLKQPGLIGLPSLSTDRNRHMYLAWSQPTGDGYADLNLTMTR
jgi:hypothetical protein